MRAFILLCFVAVACADKLGYNYHPVAHSDEGLSQSVGGASLAAPQEAQLQQAPLAAEYQKEFYTYSAPHDDDDAAANDQIANSVKKSLRVVFIRAPENRALENAALSLARQASEDKTAIYVLSKQADIGSLAQQLQALRSQASNKPEVHFVKYRTAADAVNAQQTIQAQYNALPGVSRSTNAGAAPVLNFASRAAAQPAAVPSNPGSGYLPAHPVPKQDYLPASLRRFRL